MNYTYLNNAQMLYDRLCCDRTSYERFDEGAR
jgi:hypothetical protein